jgi:hypothetical protein
MVLLKGVWKLRATTGLAAKGESLRRALPLDTQRKPQSSIGRSRRETRFLTHRAEPTSWLEVT